MFSNFLVVFVIILFAFFFYLLGGYVVLQFTWWGYHLIQLTKEITVSEQIVNKRIGMIIGEGMVFLLI
jgi:hypothetical protein